MAEMLTGILAAVWVVRLARKRVVAHHQPPPLREQEQWAAEQLYGVRR